MNEETWKTIKGSDERYEVSNTGKVRSLFYKSKRNVPLELKLRKSRRGYLYCTIYNNTSKITTYIHNIVSRHFLGEKPENFQVNHIDGIKINNEASNLEYVSAKENIRHAIDIGLMNQKGSRNIKAKLKEAQVLEIFNSLENRRDLGRKYGVSPYTIDDIRRGYHWSHITNKYYKPKNGT